MPVIPTSGTFRVHPVSTGLSLKQGEFQIGIPAGNCAVDIVLAATDAVIAAGLSTISNADRVRVWQGFPLYCSPTCFGLYAPARDYEIEISTDDHAVIFNPGGSQIIADFWTAQFPMGFLATALQVVWKGTADKGGITQDITNFNIRYNRDNVYSDAAPDINDTVIASGATIILPNNVYTGAVTSIFSLLGINFTMSDLSIAATSCGDLPYCNAAFYTDYLYLQGNYILWSVSLTKTPDVGGPGTIVTITDGTNKLLDVTEILIYTDISDDIDEPSEPIRFSIHSPYVLSWTAGELIFQVPMDLNIPVATLLSLALVVDGTTFSGEIPMGILSPILTDGSGIYTLSSGKRNDTYYDRSELPVGDVTEVDIRIPTPYIKTGFFNAD